MDSSLLKDLHFERVARRGGPRLECPARDFPFSVFVQPGCSLGGHTWSSSVALARFLLSSGSSLVKEKRIVELGSGTGVLGIACCFAGAKSVLLTDLSINLDMLCQTCELHRQQFDVQSDSLDWRNEADRERIGSSFDVCVMSDVVYYENEALFQSLVETLKAVVPRVNGSVLMSYRERSPVEKIFFELMKKADFKCEKEVALDDQHTLFQFVKIL
jgi:predicted nicotinamide N-methyase